MLLGHDESCVCFRDVNGCTHVDGNDAADDDDGAGNTGNGLLGFIHGINVLF